MEISLLVSKVAIGLAGLIVGFLLGWISRSKFKSQVDNESQQFITGLVILLVWTVLTLAELFVDDYTMSDLVHGLVGLVVGHYFYNGIASKLPWKNTKK